MKPNIPPEHRNSELPERVHKRSHAEKDYEECNNHARDNLIHAGLLAACVVKLSVGVGENDFR